MLLQQRKLRFEASLIFLTILITATLFVVWFSVRLVHSAKQNIISSMEIELARLERSFTDKVDHTFSIINSINSKIAEDPYNKNHIKNILTVYRNNPSLTNTFSWTLFSWLDSQHHLIVDGKYGIVANPIDLSIRDYVQLTEKENETFHLGTPVIGETSGKWMIPGGVGITDINGNYLGATTIGFEIESMAKILHNVVENPHVNFRLYGKNGAPILHGSFKSFDANKSSEDSVQDMELEKIINDINTENSKRFSSIALFQNRHAFIAKKIESYPYIFIVNYDKNSMMKELLYVASSRLSEIFSILFAVITLLVLIYREIKQTKRLLRMKLIAERANNSKTEFLIKATHEFKNFVFGIQGCAEIIKDDLRRLGELLKKEHNPKKSHYLRDVETDLELTRNIIDASHDIDHFINDLIELNRYKDNELRIRASMSPVNIGQIINGVITSLKKRAKNADIILISEVAKDLHKLPNLDPKRLKQIINGLITNSIKHGKSGTVIVVSATNIKDEKILKNIYELHGIKKSKAIEILIKDQNADISQHEIRSILQSIKSLKKLDIFATRLPTIKYLIEKQGGIFEIKPGKNDGNEVKIIF
jgi:signal transduction histidine kinase